ncbi:MAG: hypothetical protein JJT94_07540 [Bernardetiaceae bacterium]|nr:hypothetical protein [Bernardetiaceae bacterium]
MSKKYLYVIVFLWFSFLTTFAVEAQPIVLDSTFLRYDLRASDFYLYQDSAHLRRVESIPQGVFKPAKDDVPSFGYRKTSMWVRLEIENQSAHEDWILHYNWVFSDTVELYVQDATGAWQLKYYAGYLVPFHNRPLDYSSIAYPLSLAEGERATFYLRIRSRGPLAIPLYIKRAPVLQSEQRVVDIFYGAYFGILIVMFLYNFAVWLFLQDRSYLYYTFTILCTLSIFAGISGYTGQYLWADTPIINGYFSKLFMGFIVIATILFANDFLETEKYAPVFKKIFRFMIVLAFIGIAHTFYDLQSSLTNRIISLHTPLLLAVGIWTWYKGNKAARFFVLAWSFYIVGGLIITLSNSGTLPATGLYRHLAEIGSAIEVVLLSLA